MAGMCVTKKKKEKENNKSEF